MSYMLKQLAEGDSFKVVLHREQAAGYSQGVQKEAKIYTLKLSSATDFPMCSNNC